MLNLNTNALSPRRTPIYTDKKYKFKGKLNKKLF